MYKYLYIVPLALLYAVMGMMFSGMFETSHGNTAYQMVVFFCFISVFLDKSRQHVRFQMFKDALNAGLFL